MEFIAREFIYILFLFSYFLYLFFGKSTLIIMNKDFSDNILVKILASTVYSLIITVGSLAPIFLFLKISNLFM